MNIENIITNFKIKNRKLLILAGSKENQLTCKNLNVTDMSFHQLTMYDL